MVRFIRQPRNAYLIDDDNKILLYSHFARIGNFKGTEGYTRLWADFRLLDKYRQPKELKYTTVHFINISTKRLPIFVYDDFIVLNSFLYNRDDLDIILNPIFTQQEFVVFPEIIVSSEKLEIDPRTYTDIVNNPDYITANINMFNYYPPISAIIAARKLLLPSLSAITAISKTTSGSEYYKVVETGIRDKGGKVLFLKNRVFEIRMAK